MKVYKPDLEEIIKKYQNTEIGNNTIYDLFTKLTENDQDLFEHRRHITENRLGFGDTAFHSMWARILEAGNHRFNKVRALEIGVFKGQIISLWALLSKKHFWPLEITAISPLQGTPPLKNKILQKIKKYVSKKYREETENGNFYEQEDYILKIKELFNKFSLDFSKIRMLKGFSSESKILKETEEDKFELLYVDGDHTYMGALQDFQKFGAKVVTGGWLVADDAGCSLPGTKFWKGHEAVSRAAEVLPKIGFKNIFNVGHNRVYEKI